MVRDYRPLLSDVAVLLEEVAAYMDRTLDDDSLETGFTAEEIKQMFDGVVSMLNELDDE